MRAQRGSSCQNRSDNHRAVRNAIGDGGVRHQHSGRGPDECVDHVPDVINRRNLVRHELEQIKHADGDQYRRRRKEARQVIVEPRRLPSRQQTEHEQRRIRVDPGTHAEADGRQQGTDHDFGTATTTGFAPRIEEGIFTQAAIAASRVGNLPQKTR